MEEPNKAEVVRIYPKEDELPPETDKYPFGYVIVGVVAFLAASWTGLWCLWTFVLGPIFKQLLEQIPRFFS